MNIKLLNYTPLNICSQAIRTCYDSHRLSDNGGDKDKELIERVGNKYNHSSVLEHLVYTFEVYGISRACLQELARHRIASLSVKSTRYTLKELTKEDEINREIASKYIVFTGNSLIDDSNIKSLITLREILLSGISNDIAKFIMTIFRKMFMYTF